MDRFVWSVFDFFLKEGGLVVILFIKICYYLRFIKISFIGVNINYWFVVIYKYFYFRKNNCYLEVYGMFDWVL